MSILINWTNPPLPADNIVIYRSTASFDKSNLPSIHVTLPATATQWEDTTNILNVVYYYRIGRVKGNDIVLSREISMCERATFGHGGNSVIRGDWDCGYMGDVSADELFTTSALSSACGISSGYITTPNPTWRKFIHGGKLKFIPNAILKIGTFNWASFYNLGMVYGTDDNGAYASLTPVTQNKRVVKDGFTYKVRLIRSYKDNPTLPSSVINKTNNGGSELAEILGRIMTDSFISGNNRLTDKPKLLNTTANTIGASQGGVIALAGITGSGGTPMLGNGNYSNLSLLANSNSMGWLPVLELVDE